MKTFKTIILAVILFTSMHGIAGDSKNINAVVQKEIQAHLSVKINRSEKVEVVFTTGENGKVNLVIAKTTDADLKRAIENSFFKLNFSGVKANTAHSIVLDLKLI